MKSIRFIAGTALLMMISAVGYSQQSNAIVFTENGEKFTAILNGLRQNEKPETNVKINGLNANFYKLKIIFDDAALGHNDFNMGIEPGTETTYIVKKNNKNEYVLRPMSSVPIAEAPPTPANTTVVVYNPNAAPYVESTTIQQTSTTTTTNTGAPVGTGVALGVNVNENGGNISMNVAGFENTGSTVTTHQTTTVTTTTTTTGSTPVYSEPPPPIVYVPGYNGPIGCSTPMDPANFSNAKNSISSKSFEDSKITMAKQIINSNCFVASQVKEVMMLFDFEASKLDFAKYAYSRTYDIGNYYIVNDVFDFESSIDDLNAYVNSQRH